MSLELGLLYGEKPFYEGLYFERDLNQAFNEKMVLEGFRFGDPFVNKGVEVIRETGLGNESGIVVRYVRRVKKDWNNFNDWKDVVEKVEFSKGSHHAIFIKGHYGLKVKLEGEDSKYITSLIKEAGKEFRVGTKKRLGLQFSKFGDEVITTFGSHLDITDNIFLTYKVLHNHLISKDL